MTRGGLGRYAKESAAGMPCILALLGQPCPDSASSPDMKTPSHEASLWSQWGGGGVYVS